MSVTTIESIVIAVLGADALFEFVKWTIERRDRKKDSPEKLLLRSLGADRLKALLKSWIHSDERTAADWEIIENLYKGYQGLNGNGEIRKLYEEAKEIPTTE